VCLLPVQDVDWSAAFPNTPLSACLRAFGQMLDALAAARAAHESAAAAHALPDEVPEEFVDPITMDMMRDPVRLPDSQIVVDRWVAGSAHGLLHGGVLHMVCRTKPRSCCWLCWRAEKVGAGSSAAMCMWDGVGGE
jgi:hypothetical protein